MKKMTLHLNVAEECYAGDGSLEFACGSNRLGHGTRDLGQVGCEACVRALFGYELGGQGGLNGFARSVYRGVVARRVAADRSVAEARKDLVEQMERVRSLLLDAARDVERAVADVDHIGVKVLMGPVDYAAQAMQAPAFVASNVRYDLLAKYAGELNAAVDAVEREVRSEVLAADGTMTRVWSERERF